MRTLEEYSVVLPPVACVDIATVAGQALIYVPGSENMEEEATEIMVRDYLFTPFGLTATIRFNPDGTIADKKMSAGSWHDLLNAAIETLALRAGIDQEDPEQWSAMAQIYYDNQAILDDEAILDDLAAERIFIIPSLESRHELLGNILTGTITMEEASEACINSVDFHNDQSIRQRGVVIDDTWSQDENEIDEAIANATMEDEVVLFGLLLEGEDQFMHTIGLSELGWPEIVVRNLDPHLSPFLLRTIVAFHEMVGAVPKAGRIPAEIMAGGLRLRHVDQADVHATFPRADGGTGTLEILFPI